GRAAVHRRLAGRAFRALPPLLLPQLRLQPGLRGRRIHQAAAAHRAPGAELARGAPGGGRRRAHAPGRALADRWLALLLPGHAVARHRFPAPARRVLPPRGLAQPGAGALLAAHHHRDDFGGVPDVHPHARRAGWRCPLPGLRRSAPGTRVMFSRRTPDELAANRLAAAIARRRASGQEIVDLTTANPTEVGIEYPVAELGAALAAVAGQPYRPDPRGLVEARGVVADTFAARGVAIDPEQI